MNLYVKFHATTCMSDLLRCLACVMLQPHMLKCNEVQNRKYFFTSIYKKKTICMCYTLIYLIKK